MSSAQQNIRAIKEKLKSIYGEKKSRETLGKIVKLIEKYSVQNYASRQLRSKQKAFCNESDIVLITYADILFYPKKKPLETLYQFVTNYLDKQFNIIHLLPCYPYSSDDGFSVIDYKKINPDLGTWKNIEKFASKYDLMIDFILNHISSQSHWFQEYLKGNPRYKNYFISCPKDTDISSVTRARAHPLLTKFKRKEEDTYLWTTFSPDQIDLNYGHAELLVKMIDVLLFYCHKKVRIIRLDAIGHIWKKAGTSCLNLNEVHLIVQLMRAVLDEVFPEVLLLTETNVPQQENISYLGNGYHEAQMIYQFALPILVLHTFYHEDVSCLLEWMERMGNCGQQTTFLNVLGTHDGIGVVPATEILTHDAVNQIIEKVKEKGGYIYYKTREDGSQEPYELNITYYSAIADAQKSMALNCQKFLASQVIMLSLAGIPGIYIHSLLGTENDSEEVRKSGQKRKINRKRFGYHQLTEKLSDPNSREYKIFQGYLKIIQKRRHIKSFHPLGKQKAFFIKKSIFSMIRSSPDNREKITVLLNVSAKPQVIPVSGNQSNPVNGKYYDIISEEVISMDNFLRLDPYQFMWLR